MNNIIRLDPDIVIASSPTPFEATNHINTIKLRIYAVYLSCAERCNVFAYKLSSLFLSLSSFLPLRAVLVVPRSFACAYGVHGEGGANTCIHVERQVGGEQLRSNLVHLPGNELSRCIVIKHHPCVNSNYVLNLSWRGKCGDDDTDDEKLMTIDQLWFKEANYFRYSSIFEVCVI